MSNRAPYDPREVLPEASEIFPRLWVGMRPETYVGYDLVVSCETHLARRPMEGYVGLTLHLPMVDEDDFGLDMFSINRAADLVIDALNNEGKVLIHCTGGLNRSGVVAARAIERYVPCSPREAVDVLRRMRDEFMLCNRAFERWVLGEGLPTPDTSAFRERRNDVQAG